MNRFEQNELAELFLRAVYLARIDEQCVWMTGSVDLASAQRAEVAATEAAATFFEALYGLRLDELSEGPDMDLAHPTNGESLPKQR